MRVLGILNSDGRGAGIPLKQNHLVFHAIVVVDMMSQVYSELHELHSDHLLVFYCNFCNFLVVQQASATRQASASKSCKSCNNKYRKIS